MILDALLQFSAAQALTTAGTVPSTNVVDLNVARDMGIGEYPYLLAEVSTTFTSGGSATLQCLFQGSTDNATFYTMAEGIAIPVADLTVGRRLLQIETPRPIGAQARPRYLRLAYVVATADMTAGAINAYLVLERRDVIAYPPGIVISN